MPSVPEGLCNDVSQICLRLNTKQAQTMRRQYTHAVRQGPCARFKGGMAETAEGFPSQRRRQPVGQDFCGVSGARGIVCSIICSCLIMETTIPGAAVRTSPCSGRGSKGFLHK